MVVLRSPKNPRTPPHEDDPEDLDSDDDDFEPVDWKSNGWDFLEKVQTIHTNTKEKTLSTGVQVFRGYNLRKV